MLTQTQRLTLVEQVAYQIQGKIENSEWPIGMRIPPEPELMQQLQVSRNTLREAIRALTYAGLLKTRQGDGTYVCSSSVLESVIKKVIQHTDQLESLEVRYALEREAAALAALRRSEEDLEALRTCLDQCRQAASQQDLKAYAHWDVEFHKMVIAASHNQLMANLYNHISEALQNMVLETKNFKDVAAYLDSHDLLYQAIANQDGHQAEEAVRVYIEQALAEYRL
ncbi:FadR family transcriptional regulator [Paenibacillus tritici]|uniref:FadR family transcriptional regulator n=1 Tax=Paenibacillus tritici TaxID=1873425 RepID=A0ABX2DLQ8_9BACL|nr:FCD domain-containing protein [Paenibacillus tritici]NQX44746.1 FadR family transcriptional regulator [Paenibacillus tritici]QUL53788.1 FadR family transcriptional regulator [Paenibacillus tritici]